MGIIENMIKKHNHKKCMTLWYNVSNQIKYNERVVVFITTMKGYEEFFEKLKENNLSYELITTDKDIVHVMITKQQKEN